MEIPKNSEIINNIISNGDKKNIYYNKVKVIKRKWITLRKNNRFINNLDWCKHINKYDSKTALKLYNFRELLKRYIMVRCNVCEKDICSKCNDVGSKKLTSDIDITIDTGIEFSITAKRLILILNDLNIIFNKDKLFHNKGKFELKRVHKFFDINFYITNFELKKQGMTNKKSFSSYFISNCYSNKVKGIINQYYFAFFEFILFEFKHKHIVEYEKALNIINCNRRFPQYMGIINNLNDMLKDTNSEINTTVINTTVINNTVINNISIVSLYENDSYHSQGSYFHVVMMIQKGIRFNLKSKRDRIIYKNLLSASIIENLCFAYLHRNKIEKYLSRVSDGLNRLKKYKIKNKHFNSLEQNIDNIKNRNSIKRELYIILNSLSILQK